MRIAAVRGFVAVVAVAGVVSGCGSTPAEREGPAESSPARWVKVSPAPLAPREAAATVWTGTEVLVFGGDQDPCPPNASCVASTKPPPVDAAAYNPTTDTWRRVADVPAGVRWAQSAVADGVVYVLVPAPSGPGRFLSYHPDTDRWADLPAPPSATWGLAAVGGWLVSWPGSHENGAGPDLVFDPAAQSWTELPPSPLGEGFDRTMVGLDGDRVLLVDLELVPDPGADRPTLYRAAVLDLAAGSWQRLPDSGVVGSDPVWLRSGGLVVNPSVGSLDGGQVGNWGRSYPTGGILDPDLGRWLPLPDVPGDGDRGMPGGAGLGPAAGDGIVVMGRWALHVADRSWQQLPELPALDGVQGARTVWAGDRLFVWGGARFDAAHPSGQLLGAGWSWRPATVGTTPDPPATTAGKPWQLIGSWLVDADGEDDGAVLRIGDDVSLWRGCGMLNGSWRADRHGLFVADLWAGSGACVGEPPLAPAWLRSAVGFEVRSDGPRLLDADGAVVARLRPGGRPTPGPDMLGSLADPPTVTDADKEKFPEPAPLPAGLDPAGPDALVGRWVPPDDGVVRPEQPALELRADGSWQSSDGCNESAGRWVVGPGGALVATAGMSTAMGCTNVSVGGWLSGAARAALDVDALVLLDADGVELGRLSPAAPAR
jgi:META domain